MDSQLVMFLLLWVFGPLAVWLAGCAIGDLVKALKMLDKEARQAAELNRVRGRMGNQPSRLLELNRHRY